MTVSYQYEGVPNNKGRSQTVGKIIVYNTVVFFRPILQYKRTIWIDSAVINRRTDERNLCY